jgi:hypothetical protein
MKLYETTIRVRASIKAHAVLLSGLLILLPPFFTEPPQFADAQQPVTTIPFASGPLNTAQVVTNLVAMNLKRARALHAYRVTETLQEDNHGFPGARRAEMVVDVRYQSPGTKQFKVQSSTGSKLVIGEVFKKVLAAEEEVLGAKVQKRADLNPDNYDFAAAGYESMPSGPAYLLQVRPRRKDKFLYRGRIWVDAKDFAVVRLEATPAKNPSFWTRKSEIEQTYMKVGDFWLPARSHSVTAIRFGGHAELTIQYQDYRITSAETVGDLPVLGPPGAADTTQAQRANAKTIVPAAAVQ